MPSCSTAITRPYTVSNRSPVLCLSAVRSVFARRMAAALASFCAPQGPVGGDRRLPVEGSILDRPVLQQSSCIFKAVEISESHMKDRI